MRLCAVLAFFFAGSAVYCQTTQKPLSQIEACNRFMSRVVRIDVADGRATGFIVSQDGWILTAAHVVFDQNTGERLHAVIIQLPDGSSETAQIFIDAEAVARDFAILKVDKTGLPFLELGTGSEISPGSEITIIGYRDR
jgi:S1-C subfamily serine protease